MKHLAVMIAAMACLTGCGHYMKDPSPQLVETQPQLVTACTMLGTISETPNADYISSYLAQREMVNKVRGRAGQLGATHIVWLHQTPYGAAAQAYRCPASAAGAPDQESIQASPPTDKTSK
ncbi:MAG: hypothetical protein M0036_21890 [Desulfobacteraceae bacterium]|nr:hypothetical protein [Desulfobacteraceae bacterium]